MVDYRVAGDIAVLEVNNPPVNALSFKVRDGIASGLERASNDDQVVAIVITGKGTFIAGADIKEFSTGDHFSNPTITDLTFLLEDSKKPVVAAVHGFALGGGLEVALGCHYRIGHLRSQYGFPEVDIGILPGATGTQRLPRVSGLKAALDLIPSGRRIAAREALQIGVLDRVSHQEDLMPDALAFARSVAHKSLAGRHTSKRPVSGAENAQALMEEALAKAKKKTPGQLSPIFCIKAVMASVQCTREEGLELEHHYALHLGTSYQARSLQYAFFAQRASVKWEIPGASYKTVRAQELKTGAVVGAGTMGTGIAVCMLNAGMPVILLEQNEKLLDMGVATIKNLYAGSVRLGKSTQAQAERCLAMLKPALDYTDLSDVDVVIEAVYENMEVKKEVFRKLDAVCKPEAFLWTNTSALNVDEIAQATRRPDKVLCAHFFVPAYYMRLLENVRGEKTSPQTIATAMEFGTKIGKIPVLVGNCYGFVGNRMQAPMAQEATFLLEEGSTPQEIDQLHENMGFPLGSFKVRDLSGNDIGWLQRKAIAKAAGVELTPSTRYLKGQRYTYIPELLCSEGRFGRKTGKGWYKYEKPHAKVPFDDPFVTDMITNFCAEQGIQRRKITPQEIHERLYFSLINEGFKVLEEGHASKPEDIDTVWLLGYSWPRHYGGPMYYADMVGVKKIYERICHYYRLYPSSSHWQPSELMKRVAENDVPMKSWTKYIPSNSRL